LPCFFNIRQSGVNLGWLFVFKMEDSMICRMCKQEKPDVKTRILPKDKAKKIKENDARLASENDAMGQWCDSCYAKLQ